LHKYCLDELKFAGLGFFSNVNGVYLGDPSLDPIMEELNLRKATIFVHPTEPSPQPQLFDISASAIEYPFETTRAITNILFKKARAKFPDVKIIFPHGGGTLPFLAERIIAQAGIPYQGGQDAAATTAQLKEYYFDLCTANGVAQLTALNTYIGAKKLVAGSDCQYYVVPIYPSLASAV
jgi:predicted TIM-barrel fold metal-dependent hydrolase